MNLQDNKLLISSCFISLLAISGCGLKGDLYQTPAATKGEGFIPEDQEASKETSQEQTAIKDQPEAKNKENKAAKEQKKVTEQELK